jgi:hypothetical protein
VTCFKLFLQHLPVETLENHETTVRNASTQLRSIRVFPDALLLHKNSQYMLLSFIVNILVPYILLRLW